MIDGRRMRLGAYGRDLRWLTPSRPQRKLSERPGGAPERRGPESLAAVVDSKSSVQLSVDVHAYPGVAAAIGTGMELEDSAIDLQGVVVSDRAAILKAADAVEVGRSRLPCRLRMRGGQSETRIVTREKAIDDALRLREGAGLGEPQFDDEPILEGAEEAFHPPLPLGRGRRDPANPQFLQGAANLRGRADALQVVGDVLWGAGVAMKQAVAIGIGGCGDPVAPDEAAEEEEVPVGVFFGAKDAGQGGARGIVDGGVQDQARPAVLQPGMMAAVHLDEEAGLGHAFTAPAVPRGATGARTSNARGAQQPLHRFPRDPDAVAFGEQFGKLMVIHSGVGALREGEDPGADRGSEAARGRPAAVAVGEGRWAMVPQAPPKPPEVTRREAQEPGGFAAPQDAVKGPGQDLHALVLVLGQGDRLPCHGRTYSLTH